MIADWATQSHIASIRVLSDTKDAKQLFKFKFIKTENSAPQ